MGHEGEQELGAGADVVVEDYQGPALIGRRRIGLAVELGDQIAALAHEGTREVDVAAALHIEAVLGQIDAQAFVQ